MIELERFLIGIIILALGFLIGDLLARHTKDEKLFGQFWFKIIIILSAVGAIMGLIYKNDALLFTFVFIAIVTSRSLKKF